MKHSEVQAPETMLRQVKLTCGLLKRVQDTNRTNTLPIEYEQLRDTGRLESLKLGWKPGDPNRPHHFWDSDEAKWLEAVGYSLANYSDPELEALADAVIDDLAAVQQEDGYLNTYYTVVEPGKRWSNTRIMHELYCAGHLIEGAVAYYQGTGKRKFLDVMCRYADYIATVFGHGEGQIPSYPGHEEIELALVKLYRATGEEKYLDLAEYFVDERGRQPHYWDVERAALGETDTPRWGGFEYFQAHAPIVEQTDIEGHSVRATYLMSGVTDVALLQDDAELAEASKRLWHSMVDRRMYVTGGIGSSANGERFTSDYDLPNDTAYAETCAAIGAVFWARRMLDLDPRGEYADVMERCLYNAVLPGVSLDGKDFFYANMLDVNKAVWDAKRPEECHDSEQPQRQPWFGCACCPPNVARLAASLNMYVYSRRGSTVYCNLYTPSEAEFRFEGGSVRLLQETDYPWDERIHLTVAEVSGSPTVALRIPGWCRKPALSINGEEIKVSTVLANGYALLTREWVAGDLIELTLPMPVERLYARPEVWMDNGCTAIQRGPILYCLEAADNGESLHALVLPEGSALNATYDADLLGGVVVITGKGWRKTAPGNGTLYAPGAPNRQPVELTFVPYYAWGNRAPGSMLVWVHTC